MKFAQIIDFETERMDEMREVMREYEEKARTDDRDVRPRSRTVLRDRDNPNRHLVIVEFDSYEEAMQNSQRADTAALSEKFGTMLSWLRTFINCDVLEQEDI